ncbi:hypothetical protein XIS1_460006 [Xenorhabdus innexi]|uniref:Uncharacterized protein n=1 Tax=Xenorhabdus innexi TaxID=290109 RepID=A0A1N6MXZ6_9GAMM|nr:hypothetical protein XIS1_460006 [Xenorhabdus innexi]
MGNSVEKRYGDTSLTNEMWIFFVSFKDQPPSIPLVNYFCDLLQESFLIHHEGIF